MLLVNCCLLIFTELTQYKNINNKNNHNNNDNINNNSNNNSRNSRNSKNRRKKLKIIIENKSYDNVSGDIGWDFRERPAGVAIISLRTKAPRVEKEKQ